MRIGILGGTFDPIHIGHLIMAEEACARLELTSVLCMPTGEPWMRKGTRISPAQDRAEMVRLAVKANPHLELSLMEVERPGDTYTVDTLRALREETPGADLYFIMGLDSLAQFHKWKDPEEILYLCTLAVQGRPGIKSQAMQEVESAIPGIADSIVWLEAPPVGVSSTDIRKRVAQGLSIRYLVLPEVEAYIYKHGLYRENGQ